MYMYQGLQGDKPTAVRQDTLQQAISLLKSLKFSSDSSVDVPPLTEEF